ncbi:DpnII family type II restriction endonuclease [Caldisericum exile]|jgi:type II restriction enzyme|uniref:DpnII family type II restriction endonuclease n=1 Tax=Caldisericum exile TaxID=693075 RepID=UPI003C707F65
MVKFKELGFKNFEEYNSYFFNTLLSSNKTYDYFVDWTKVKEAVNQYLNELSLLNSLTKVEPKDRKKHLQDLLLKYPQVVEVIPLLIAERLKNGKIDIFDPNIEELITFEFKHSSNVSQIINFCYKTGILDLFQEVKDIHDYLLGVEVGLDTNARKNRSGDIFEKMCQQKIKKFISTANYLIIENDSNFSLYPIVSKGRGKGKTHDVVIYKEKSPILVIECNFYNVTGSKPISIAESYIEMNRAAQENGIDFLWVTDGPAWHQMKEPLLRSMKEIDWILNFKMLDLVAKILKI